MARVVIRHQIETPVRYQGHFATRSLEDCRLDHALYALPGPEIVDLGPGRPVGEAQDEERRPERSRPRFQVLVDVVQFFPEDVLIQTFEGWLLVRAQHGPRMDEHGFISRSFTRQYKLPDGVETKDLSALFCHDGVLVVEVKGPEGPVDTSTEAAITR
ncbi:heat shock protein beta-3 [Tachyglossus aculeatus]|uniref:heat shock protein beta-3 n=1 Tax=Tachyglossus aculeatus TaxID=9261 RepID=UPI0018F52DB5|nr:heat shock protein beta-3 [Tachyglossus aculeatus]